MSGLEKKTPDEWLQEPDFEGIVVMDPDGWDRKNYEESWAEPITSLEMSKRLGTSTCTWPIELIRRAAQQG